MGQVGGLWGYRDWANIEIMILRKVVPTPSSVGGRLGCGGICIPRACARPPPPRPPAAYQVPTKVTTKLTMRLLRNPGSEFVRRGRAARGGRTKPRLTSKPKPEVAAEAEAEVEARAEAECAPEVAFSWAFLSCVSSRVT